MNYVTGFYLSTDLSKVVMIHKRKPAWQAGKLNGIGGMIEEAVTGENFRRYGFPERPEHAMAREFEEETGLLTMAKDWHCFHIENYKGKSPDGQEDTKVYYFVLFGDRWNEVHTCTKEKIEVIEILDIKQSETVFNIPYLLVMLLTHAVRRTLINLDPEGVNSK